MIDRQRLLARFLRYVRVDTTANDATEEYPSSPGQWELGRMLLEELKEIGLSNAKQDEHGIVSGVAPATVKGAPTIAFNSHLDTSPETTGKGVNPQVIESYDGGDIVLRGDPSKMIVAAETPELANVVGKTIITTDGTTLLGGDDKAGVAVIVETVACLMEHPEIARGAVEVLFTCDEEIGRGVQHVDVSALEAVACYTLDGQSADEIDVETFSADLATVVIRGVNIHPAIAKDRMVNAVKAAGEFLTLLPRDRLSPETTEDREGFVHPYSILGGVAETTLKILLRDFDTSNLAGQLALLEETARAVEKKIDGIQIEVSSRPQYRNMADGLRGDPRAVEYAIEAHRNLGREPKQTIVRGGTDGSQLTEKGLPTPNLSTGQHSIHSPLEWACLDEMVQAGEVLLEISKVWASKSTR